MHQAILAEDPEAIRESMREFALSVDRVDEIERSGEHIGKWVAAYKDKLPRCQQPRGPDETGG